MIRVRGFIHRLPRVSGGQWTSPNSQRIRRLWLPIWWENISIATAVRTRDSAAPPSRRRATQLGRLGPQRGPNLPHHCTNIGMSVQFALKGRIRLMRGIGWFPLSDGTHNGL